jgi:hypothetical protein
MAVMVFQKNQNKKPNKTHSWTLQVQTHNLKEVKYMGRFEIKELVDPSKRYVELRDDIEQAEHDGRETSADALKVSEIVVMRRIAEGVVELVEEYKKRQKKAAKKKTGNTTTTQAASNKV